VSLFDPLGQAPILTNQPSPVVASVNVNSDGTTTVFALDVGGRPLATFQEVPEPGTMLLFGFGASGLFMLRKIRR
jgi:hypothetical protein